VKFLCDVHIPLRLSKRLAELGHQSEHVNWILEKWLTKDIDIIEHVDANGLVFITKDQDFRNSYLLTKKPKKLIKVNLGNISNNELIKSIETLIEQLIELDKENNSFMIEVNSNNYFTRIN
jgi:predicted nuclease of predicted toxin-antitoxin system